MSPLLHFKLGFSNRTHDFAVWRWVLLPDVYRRLCLEKSRWNEQHGRVSANVDFFPDYRTPMVPAAVAPSRVTAPSSTYLTPWLAQGVTS